VRQPSPSAVPWRTCPPLSFAPAAV